VEGGLTPCTTLVLRGVAYRRIRSTFELQNVYPGKPIYNPSVVTIDAAMMHEMGTTAFTEWCTKDLEQVYQDTVGTSYTHAVKKHLKASL